MQFSWTGMKPQASSVRTSYHIICGIRSILEKGLTFKMPITGKNHTRGPITLAVKLGNLVAIVKLNIMEQLAIKVFLSF